jgi:CRISPR-associated endonuclease/helicase Cas3
MKELNFVEFFTDVHGYAPLPWQERLAETLITDHIWPDLIDLPTASGKTACIDIAVFHLAWCADRGEPWRAARRITFVVDRRIIVDAAAVRADLLECSLKNQPTESIKRVATALMKLGGSKPLIYEKLRGGMAYERGFALSPTQPMIITSTVDQVGSRLLFRGYGMSRYSYPIHAGLLGYDTLLLVDEAHLSQPFLDTVAAIRARQQQAEQHLGLIQPLCLVPLSATARTERSKFQLDACDLANEYLRERRTTPKPARIVEVGNKYSDRMKTLLRETRNLFLSLNMQAPAIAVIVNRVRTARALYDALVVDKWTTTFDIELMIGRSRPLDRDVIAKRLLDRVGVNRPIRERGVIVVATQTIEVGADLDFHGLVTECAALDALRQRFGRVDRLGKFRAAQAVIVGGGENADDPVYGSALPKTWAWLNEVASQHEGMRMVDFSIESMEGLMQIANVSALASPTRAQLIMTPLHFDLLCQTSPTPIHGPDIQALLHGLGAGAPDVQVIWRAGLPLSNDGMSLDESRFSVAKTLLELNPPTSLESMSLPLISLRSWLSGVAKDDVGLTDIEGASETESDDKAKSSRWVLRRTHDGWEKSSVRNIRPGDTVVVPNTFGGCDDFGFAPSDTRPVTDLSATAREKLKKSLVVVITQQWIEALGIDSRNASHIWQRLSEDRERAISQPEILNNLLESIEVMLPEELRWITSQPVIDIVPDLDNSIFALVLTQDRVQIGDISDEDMSSSQTVPVPLCDHNAGVGTRARALGEALQLDPHHVEHVALAGQLHDVGKADPRFQKILRFGDDGTLPGVLLAKGFRSSSLNHKENVERHEAYSVALIDRHPALLKNVKDPELVRYLVGVHHGRGRALMPDRNDEGTAFNVEIAGQDYSFNGPAALGSLKAGWSSLFWRMNERYGPWQLAYLESILRLADWLQSAEELRKTEPR